MTTRRINIPGQGPRDVEALSFRDSGEYWNEYLLDDGTRLRIKLVVKSVYRIPDQYDPEGNPSYIVSSGNIMQVDAPDELRRVDGP